MEETDLTALCKSDENVLKRNHHSEIWPKSTPVVSELLFYLPFPFARDETDLPAPWRKGERSNAHVLCRHDKCNQTVASVLFAG